MALQSDVTIDVSKFQPQAASQEVRNLNEYLMDLMKKGPKWFEVALHPAPRWTICLPDTPGRCR